MKKVKNKHSEGVIRRCKDIHRQVDTTITERRVKERERERERERTAEIPQKVAANERMAMVVGIVWPSMAGLVQTRERYANVWLGQGFFGESKFFSNCSPKFRKCLQTLLNGESKVSKC